MFVHVISSMSLQCFEVEVGCVTCLCGIRETKLKGIGEVKFFEVVGRLFDIGNEGVRRGGSVTE